MDNNLNTQNSSGMMNGMPPMPPKEEKKIGPVVGILIIVLALIIGALYFFNQKLTTSPVDTSTQAEDTTLVETTSVETARPDDVDSIQADLDAQLKDVDYSF